MEPRSGALAKGQIRQWQAYPDFLALWLGFAVSLNESGFWRFLPFSLPGGLVTVRLTQ